MTKYVCAHTYSFHLEKDANWEFGADARRRHLASRLAWVGLQSVNEFDWVPFRQGKCSSVYYSSHYSSMAFQFCPSKV